jgi:polyisoprenoid-binding protein YceI
MRFRNVLAAGLLCAIGLCVVSSPLQAADTLKPKLDKSKITFVGHKPEGKHEGGFKKFEVEAKADMEAPEKSSLKIEIKTESLWSDDDKLTAHLKNPDFFDVRKYPMISFESTKVIHSEEEGKAKIVGKLTMLGKTEEVEVPVTMDVKDESIKIVATFKLDRTKWGMDYGKGKINDEVDIVAELLFDR